MEETNNGNNGNNQIQHQRLNKIMQRLQAKPSYQRIKIHIEKFHERKKQCYQRFKNKLKNSDTVEETLPNSS